MTRGRSSRDHADDRADALLDGHGLNGMRLALVALPAGPNPTHADLDLRFWNSLHVAAILAEIARDPGARRADLPRARRHAACRPATCRGRCR